ncbi:MAG: hypothetical protein U0Y08_15725 [Bacteroidia bacterium]
MRRCFLFFLFVITPFAGNARKGWSFVHYSLYAGQQYRPAHLPQCNIEFRYDRFGESCLKYKHYRGAGLNYSFNPAELEYGLTGMLNPFRLLIQASRRTKFYPYLYGKIAFCQFQYSKENTEERNPEATYFLQPGIGLTGNFREDTSLPVKLFIQFGYQVPCRSSDEFSASMIANIGIGLGLNFRRLNNSRPKSESKDLKEGP